MLINGQRPQGINVVAIVLPRANADDLVFKAQAVLDMESFDTLFPRPEPPTIIKPGLGSVPDFKDKNYLESLEKRSYAHTDYMILKSLEATPNLKWETVDLNDPATYGNWRKEAKEAGLVDVEINRIIMGVMEANALNEKVIDEARKRFLATQAVDEARK
jgi:hypothetical protein